MTERTALPAIAALVLTTFACEGRTPDAGTGDARSDPAVTAEPTDPRTATLDEGPALTWRFAGSESGALRQIVAWSDGFAALHSPNVADGAENGARPELWCSDDGVDWEPARTTPGLEQVYGLAGHDGDLFALNGDPSDLAAPQTLWHRSGGSPWEVVLSHEHLERIAIGADRVVAYRSSPFEVIDVYEAATLEQVEHDGIPDFEPPEQVTGPSQVFEAPRGAVIGLDDGFLARVDWAYSSVGSDDPASWLLYSADGSSWTEHPGASAAGVVVREGERTAPNFDGLNLLTAPRPGPLVSDTLLVVDRWQNPDDLREQREREASWVTDTGIDLRSTAPAAIDAASGTALGFFDVVRGAIRHSLDGISWVLVESPPTWSVMADFDARGLAEATVLDGVDGVIAVGVHGAFEPYGGVVEATTEIWVTD